RLFHVVALETEGAGQVAQRADAGRRRVRLQLLEDVVVAVELLHLVLREVTQSYTGAGADRAAVGRQHAGHHLEERGLAGAVFAHDGPALAAPHQQRQTVMHGARAVFLDHPVDLDDVVAGARRLAEIEALLDDAARRL